LENVIQRAVVVSPGEEVSARDIRIPGRRGTDEEPRALTELPYIQAREHTLRAFQKAYVKSLLDRSNWNISKAAQSAHVTRAALYAIMKKAGLSAKRVGQESR
jgi:DNA-binding NtrC family response regulator